MKIWFAAMALLVAINASSCDSTAIKVNDLSQQDISIPVGFKNTIIVNTLGRNRHISVAANGDLFVKLEKLSNGKGIFQLRETNGIWKVIDSFCNYTGTGIAVKNNFLYASSDEEVFKYTIGSDGRITNVSAPEKIITGLASKRQHASKSIALDNAGNIYVNIGAYSNACQVADRTAGSPGQDPCPILEEAGGIWQFKTNALNQSYKEGLRYVTGLRNVVGLDWNASNNELYVMQHGRDQLGQLNPDMYNDTTNAELPSEEFILAKKGNDFGWPYCYYDHLQGKKILGPEYGGDGKKQGRCADKDQPIMGFPGHWAPNALLFYTGNQFPERYKNGAFIAFHGSWNRAPMRQGGYLVAFVPMKDGKPSGPYEIFANGFTGKEELMSTGDAKYRPCGLAMSADGSLLVSDSKAGRIWKISYKM